MSNLLEIQNQIAILQRQADEIKAQQFSQVVQEIMAKMDAFGITVADLDGGKSGRSRKSGYVPTKSLNPAPPKYRGPNGESWTGRGLTPRWLTALIDEGHTKEEYAIAF